MPLMKDANGVLLVLTVESKLLLVVLMDKKGEKGICQVNSYKLGTRGCADLLKQ